MTLCAELSSHPEGAGFGLKPCVTAVTPGRGPGYLHLLLVPLHFHLLLTLQLLQPPLELVPGLAPLPHLIKQQVGGVHLLVDFSLELLLGCLEGHASIHQAGGRARWALAGAGGPAWKNSPQGRAGDAGKLIWDIMTPWQDGRMGSGRVPLSCTLSF